MARFGDGLAVGSDLACTAETAVAQALAPLGGQRPDLLCVFVCGSEPNDPATVEAAGLHAMAVSGATTTLGCSAEGVIGGSRGIELTNSVSAWAGVLPGVRMTPFQLEAEEDQERLVVSGMPEGPGENALALLLAEPHSFPTAAFVEHSNEVLQGLPMVGGLASSPQGEDGNRLFVQGEVVRSGAVGVLLDGEVALRTVVSQGCRPVGPSMTVTKAEGKVIYELAGKPALTRMEEVVEDLPGEDRRLLRPALLLGIAMNEYRDQHEYGDFLVRMVVGADAESGAVQMLETVEVGRTVRLQVRDAGTAATELDDLFARFRQDAQFGTAEGALLFSCNGRGSALFPSPDHDVLAVRRGLGASGVGGFFAAGEIGPVADRNHVHGFTASILAFGANAADGH